MKEKLKVLPGRGCGVCQEREKKAYGMAQQVKVLAAKSGDLNPIPRVHMGGEGNQLPQMAL